MVSEATNLSPLVRGCGSVIIFPNDTIYQIHRLRPDASLDSLNRTYWLMRGSNFLNVILRAACLAGFYHREMVPGVFRPHIEVSCSCCAQQLIEYCSLLCHQIINIYYYWLELIHCCLIIHPKVKFDLPPTIH